MNLLRSFTARLRQYANDRRQTLRRDARFEARLHLLVSLLGTDKGSMESLSDVMAIEGYTRDVSETGLTLLLPSVRIKGKYLTDGESYLGVRLELPSGQVTMLTVSVRFEQLPKKEVECAYLLGVRIVRMENSERARYTKYLSTLKSKEERRAHSQREIGTAIPIGQNSSAQLRTWEDLTPESIIKAFEKFLGDQTHPHKL